MPELTSLFLAQSCRDTWEDYQRSLTQQNFPRWDYVVLTAGDSHQAGSYRLQLHKRQEQGLLPTGTRFLVFPDPEGKKVGSGGATLSVIGQIAALEQGNLAGIRALCIHSGGDSRRIPQYSVLGKLFSPVPRQLPDGRPATLFDELIITMSSLAPRLSEGMLLLSGDALLQFNPLQIDPPGRGACVISFKAPLARGAHHGVFIPDPEGRVARFLHKRSPETLNRFHAADDRGMVNIDTGAVILAPDVLARLLDFAQETTPLSLYGDLLYPMAEDSTLEEFLAEPAEIGHPEDLAYIREKLWYALRPFRLRLLRPAPARFLHFGTTQEVLSLMTRQVAAHRHLGWQSQVCSSAPLEVAAWCSIAEPTAQVGKGCYLESSRLRGKTRLGDRVFLSCLELQDRHIPDGLVLHGLKLRCGGFVVRFWSVDEDTKTGTTFLGKPLPEGLTLWNAPLFPVKATRKEALDAALALYNQVTQGGDDTLWRRSRRVSLAESFRQADPEAALQWQTRMEALVRMEQLAQLVRTEAPVSQAAAILRVQTLTPVQRQWLAEQKDHRIRLQYYLGKALGRNGEPHLRESFLEIRKATVFSADAPKQLHIAKESVTHRLPLRVNFGGGWSDTPPYCQDKGGAVLNAAITLEGRCPVEVTVERLPQNLIRLQSEDTGALGEFDRTEALQVTGDPSDPFALPKAALTACGILPQDGASLKDHLEAIGGGFLLRSQVRNVPKGSGLGTSSILSASCAGALFDFFGIPHAKEDITQRVLVMEQLMDTGGGWQDQIGGLYPGIKFITSAPGLLQQPVIRPLTLSEATREALENRFALIYTGQRRLARNLLREVVGRYLGREPAALEALEQIQDTAAQMAFQLERGHVDRFGSLLNHHWNLSKQLDPGSTNTLLDQILWSVSPLICGQMVCGAGGGGFLQVILKPGVTREALEDRLRQVFRDHPVAVWPASFLWS